MNTIIKIKESYDMVIFFRLCMLYVSSYSSAFRECKCKPIPEWTIVYSFFLWKNNGKW